MEETAYTYMVECGDGSLYTGWTNQLEERIRCHNSGKGAKYTRARLPVRLRYYEKFKTRQEAMKREYAIKHLKRKDKLMLLQQLKPEQMRYAEQINEKVLGKALETNGENEVTKEDTSKEKE